MRRWVRVGDKSKPDTSNARILSLRGHINSERYAACAVGEDAAAGADDTRGEQRGDRRAVHQSVAAIAGEAAERPQYVSLCHSKIS